MNEVAGTCYLIVFMIILPVSNFEKRKFYTK